MEKKNEKKVERPIMVGGPEESVLPPSNGEPWFSPTRKKAESFRKSGKALAQRFGRLAALKKR